MACVMEHYIRHHEVVLKKLNHAHQATLDSISELEAMMATLNRADADIHEIRKYDKLWAGIIELFRESGVSEDELNKIEKLLEEIPRVIHKHYEILLQKDKALLAMIEELGADKYRRAFDMIRQAQSGPNAMSGLDPAAYDQGSEDNGEADAPRHLYDVMVFKEMPGKKKPGSKDKR